LDHKVVLVNRYVLYSIHCVPKTVTDVERYIPKYLRTFLFFPFAFFLFYYFLLCCLSVIIVIVIIIVVSCISSILPLLILHCEGRERCGWSARCRRTCGRTWIIWTTWCKGKFTNKKGKGSPYSIAERMVPELIPVLGSEPAGDVSHKPGGSITFRQARSYPHNPYEGCYQFRCLVNRGTMGVNSLPKTVTRQRRGCDLNPRPSAPEFSTLTTLLPSHPQC